MISIIPAKIMEVIAKIMDIIAIISMISVLGHSLAFPSRAVEAWGSLGMLGEGWAALG